MKFSVPYPDGTSVIELETRSAICVAPGCGGTIVRHSLGSAQSVDRCTRCFRRYQLRVATTSADTRSRLRRFVDDFVAWRD